MQLLCLSDLHGQAHALDAILSAAPRCDAVLLGGDLSNFGAPKDVSPLLRASREIYDTVFAVSGNCDSPDIDVFLAAQDVSLHDRGRVLGEVGFFGLSAIPTWTGRMHEYTETELASFLRNGNEALSGCERKVLLSHCPPRGLCDRIRSGESVGSTAVRECVDDVAPILVVCGHVHEARGQERHGDTLVLNCGTAYRGYYAIVSIDASGYAEAELCDAPGV